MSTIVPPTTDSQDQNATLLRVAQHLTFELVGGYCDLTAEPGDTWRGQGRCSGRSAAIRWENGFVDLICWDHAVSAERRGATVIYPRRAGGDS